MKADYSRRWWAQPVGWVAAAYGMLIYGTLPPGVAVLNDDFGYLRSIIETLQRGRPWTDDWLEPWSASLSVLSALVFKFTGSFHMATQGVQAVCAAGAVAGAAALFQDRGVSPSRSAVAGLLLVSFPTVMWKSVEFTGMVLYLPCLLWAIRAAGRRQWGVFFAVWLVAGASRQSAVTWLALPAWAGVAAIARGVPWRRPAWVLAGAAAWIGVLHEFMNRTQSQALITARWYERAGASSAGPNLVMGMAVVLGAIGLGRFILLVNQPERSAGTVPPLRVLAALGATAMVLVLLAGNAPMYFEHASFEGHAGLLFTAGLGACAVAGWIIGCGVVRGDFLLASGASLALVAIRSEVWDYYYVDVAFFALFAATPGTDEQRTSAPAKWLRAVALGCGILCGAFQGYFVWVTKCRVDRESVACRLAEISLRAGTLEVTELNGLPMGFVGWQLHPHFVAHEGRGDADIGGFQRYLRSGAIELRRSPRRFWSDSSSLRPVDGADAVRVLASEVTRVGWFWHERCTLLRSPDGGASARLAFDRSRYQPVRFPLNDQEWRELILSADTR
jgi:hypothetical protein